MKKVEIISPTILQTNQKYKLQKIRVAAYCRVSTDSDEQLNSYESQIKFYNQKISENPDWVKVDIYADEGISGTQVKNRDDFLRMIRDAEDGKIDLILCKSISRFGRNTVDILKYIRKLKSLKIPVFFEEEGINTMEMQGEILLTVLASLAQQGSSNISSSSCQGNKMKMMRGEPVGQYNVYGYRYDKEIKNFVIVEEEAEVVKKVFELYTTGLGTGKVAKKMNELGYVTPEGKKWRDTTVGDMIKNYKYRGDLMQGQSYTVDPIEHIRAENHGEKPFYYAEEHHEGIIDKATWDYANELLQKRRQKFNGKYAPNKYSCRYPFSSKIVCGYCGNTYNRWSRKIGKDKHDVVTWVCSTKKQKKYGRVVKTCDNYNYRQETIENAFVKVYSKLCENNKIIIEKLLNVLNDILSGNCYEKELQKLENQLSEYKESLSNLVDLKLKAKITEEIYDSKYSEINSKIDEFVLKIDEYKKMVVNEEQVKNRIDHFQRIFNSPDILKEFSESAFEILVDKIVIGKIEEDGTKNPNYIKFILNTGTELTDNLPNDKRKKKKTVVLGDKDVAQNNVSYYGNGEWFSWSTPYGI